MKYLTRFAVLLCFLVVAVPVLAQGRVSQATTTRGEARVEAQERRASTTEERLNRLQDRAKEMLSKAIEHLNRIIARFENIANRLDSRIGKLEADGLDATESKGFVREGRVRVEEAKLLIADLATLDISGETLGQNVARMRAAVNGVKFHLREAHQLFVQAVRALPKPERNVTN